MKYLVILFITLLCLTPLKAQILTQEEKERIILSLNDSSLNARSAALDAIIDYKITEAEDSLKNKIWSDSRSIQIDYLLALLALNSTVTEEFTLAYLDTLDAISLGKPDFASYVLELKVRATKILFELQNYSTVGYVFDLIQQDKPDVNIWAIDLLPQIVKHVPSYAELAKNELIYASTNASSEIDRLNSMVNLVFLFGEEALPLLLSACEQDESPAIRSSIIAQFLPDEPIVNTTLRTRLFQEEESTIRSQIIDFLLFRFGTPSDFKYVSDFIELELDSLVKRMAIQSLSIFIPPIPDSLKTITLMINDLVDLTDTIHNYTWLSDLQFKDELQSILQSAKTNLLSGDSLACAIDVKAVQENVDNVYKDSLNTDPRFVTIEGWKFLYWNAQYILDRLPEISEGESISTYSIFATHSIRFNKNLIVLSGDIGVNDTGLPPLLEPGYELLINANTVTPAGYKVKANRIMLKLNSAVNGDIYYNQLNNSSGIINGTETTPIELPLFADLPEFKTSSPGTEDIIVPKNGERLLPSGNYGNITINKNGKLVLIGGVYHFNSFESGMQSSVVFQTVCAIRIAAKLDVGKESYIGPADTTTMSAKGMIIYAGGINGSDATLAATPKAAVIGADCIVKTNIYVPNGTLWIKSNSTIEGGFIGQDINIDAGVKVKFKSAF